MQEERQLEVGSSVLHVGDHSYSCSVCHVFLTWFPRDQDLLFLVSAFIAYVLQLLFIFSTCFG